MRRHLLALLGLRGYTCGSCRNQWWVLAGVRSIRIDPAHIISCPLCGRVCLTKKVDRE